MKEHLFGEPGDLYYTGPLRGPGLAGKTDEMEGEKHFLCIHPLFTRDFAPAGDVLSVIHGWDHEMPHSNLNLFCLALGSDASLAAPKPKLMWVELLAKL